jgi:uncharacterized protein YraI
VGTVTADSVRLRSGPGPEYGTVGLISTGQAVTVTNRSADGVWWQAAYGGQTVWLSIDFVTVPGCP